MIKMKNNKQIDIICPDCEAKIEKSKNLMVGDILECDQCGTEVEILSLEPLKYQELVEEK